MIEYLHPSVRTRITDNSMTFVTAQGLTQMFVAFTSDKGVDNKIQRITTPSEWFFHYGEPDMKKHGQAAYNAVNWLTSGGGVYALRVSPDNASYAHTFIDIQTKIGTKEVRDNKDDLVSVPNVELRPSVAYSKVNNNSKVSLESELTRTNRSETLDGFKHNFLMAILPKGRGLAYNNLGFRLRLTSVYDETYKFRLFNFEVTETKDSGSIEVIEGPYHVSLDPDAISRSNESLFITDVIDKYSDYVEVIFNEDVYDKLGEIINPHVNPAVLDFFSGSTRIISGEKETYFNETTMKEEDVHLAIRTYSNEGEYLGESNITESDDFMNENILNIDLSLRNDRYASKLKNLQNKYKALSRFRISPETLKNEIKTLADVDESFNLVGGDIEVTLNDIDALYDDISNRVDSVDENTSSSDLNELVRDINILSNHYKKFLSQTRNIMDLTTTIINNDDTLKAEVDTNSIESFTHQNMITSIRLSTLTEESSVNLSTINDLKVSSKPNMTYKTETTYDLLISASDIIDILTSYDSPNIEIAEDVIENCKALYFDAYSKYDAAIDDYILDEEREVKMNETIHALDDLFKEINKALNLSRVESQITLIENIQPLISEITSSVFKTVIDVENKLDSANSTDLIKLIEDEIKSSIDRSETELNSEGENIFTSYLQDYTNYVKLLEGSDGDLGNEGKRADVTRDLLIKAYRGIIDERILNKKEIQIDLLLDANYDVSVKSTMHQLSSEIREDCMTFLDTGFQATPEQVLEFRQSQLQMSSWYTAVFAQDFIVHDEFLGKDIKVTTPYFLASKIPQLDRSPGFSYPMAGPRRGTISGFKSLSFNPSPVWKEEFYRRQINYIEQDPARTNLATQLTSQSMVTALSQINNVRTLLRIRREVEELSEQYRLEFNDDETIQSFQENLNILLDKWRNNRACKTVTGQVYASDYDRQQGILRVRVEVSFTSITERIIIDINVER